MSSESPRVQASVQLRRIAYDTTCDTAKLTVLTIAGIAASLLSIVTGGMNKKINEYADLTQYSAQVLPILFIGIVRIANPNQKVPERLTGPTTTEYFVKPIIDYGNRAKRNHEGFKKQFVSRGAFALTSVVATVTAIADMILGCSGVVLSLITLGQSQKINAFAMRNLTFPSWIDNICHGFRYTINPHQQR